MKNNTRNLAVLMFVMFSFCMSISSVQAKLSNNQCKTKVEALDEKYDMVFGDTKEKSKEEELRSIYGRGIQFLNLLEEGCVNSAFIINRYGKINVATAKTEIEGIRAECEKVTKDPNCGYIQTPNTSTENKPQANNTSTVKSTSSTSDAAEASKVLASYGSGSQSKSCLRQRPKGDQLEISDTCPSSNRHVSTELFYCLVGRARKPSATFFHERMLHGKKIQTHHLG